MLMSTWHLSVRGYITSAETVHCTEPARFKITATHLGTHFGASGKRTEVITFKYWLSVTASADTVYRHINKRNNLYILWYEFTNYIWYILVQNDYKISVKIYNNLSSLIYNKILSSPHPVPYSTRWPYTPRCQCIHGSTTLDIVGHLPQPAYNYFCWPQVESDEARRHLYFHWSVNFYFYLGEALFAAPSFSN
jgi:hypothetical protein